jgi:hypothetical protein
MPSGSKPGEKRGGRKKGTPNKRESLRRQAIAQTGVTPLEFMLGVMANTGNPPLMRLDAAKSAAPYVHARLQAVTIGGDPDNPLRHEHAVDLSGMSDAELAHILGHISVKTSE